jgi:DNA-binding beta-propeller fold protein YncE
MWGSFCDIRNGNGCNLFIPGSIASGDGQFNGPQGIAVDSSNNIYIVDNSDGLQFQPPPAHFEDNGRIQVFAPPPPPCRSPTCFP